MHGSDLGVAAPRCSDLEEVDHEEHRIVGRLPKVPSTLPAHPMVVSPSPQITVQVCGTEASKGTTASDMSVVSSWSWWALIPARATVVSPIASASISKMQISRTPMLSGVQFRQARPPACS